MKSYAGPRTCRTPPCNLHLTTRSERIIDQQLISQSTLYHSIGITHKYQLGLMSDDNDSLVCPTCYASFRRAEHLRRHLASRKSISLLDAALIAKLLADSSLRPFKCNSCSSAFKRRYVKERLLDLTLALVSFLTVMNSDVLRKHLKVCSRRLGQDVIMPEPLPIGKKVTSCDQCAHTKKRCDRKLPCSTCTAKHHSCTYERQILSTTPATQFEAARSLVEDYASDAELNYDFHDDLDFCQPFSLPNLTDADWLDLDWNVPSQMQVLANGSSRNELHSQNQLSAGQALISVPNSSSFQPSFDFLLNFTRASGLKAVFNYKRCRSPLSGTNNASQESKDPYGPTFESMTAGPHQSQLRGRSGSSRLSSHKVSLVGLIESLDDPLFVQTKAIWDTYRTSRIRSSQMAFETIDDPDCADERCLRFFCPGNLRRFIRLFWDEWYPHCPIIHKPTFNALNVPVILLVPMAITGAFMSESDADVKLAMEWLEFGEEIVFASAILSAEPVERAPSDVDIPPLRIIQAAYLTCIMLNWEGSDTMKRRVRHHHFAALVSVSRVS